ncbi:MAG: GNAT family N-acetyltransferase [bacterium]|nr:GNAT family N-acetyltransferase [bacterium]
MSTKLNFEKFPKHIIEPAILADSEKFLIKIAETQEEIDKTLRMRYEVFNIEQGHGLDDLQAPGMDIDKYDKYCLQLIVLNKETNLPVGTYRAHLGSIATKSIGFYSVDEYEIKGLEKIASLSMEVGRSCVTKEFRRGSAVALLWGGIGELMMRAKLRYLFGCVSFEEYNPAATWAVYEHLKQENLLSELIDGNPRKGYELERPPENEIQKYLDDIRNTFKKYVPPLLKGYLRLGTKIAGPPLYDPKFKTIDFLIILDSFTIPERYARHYNYNAEK